MMRRASPPKLLVDAGAALAGSNMENYELVSQAVHVEEGALSGLVVNSERQLWSVAGYLSMVVEGVFGAGRWPRAAQAAGRAGARTSSASNAASP